MSVKIADDVFTRSKFQRESKDETYKDAKGNSNFLITFNPNVSHKVLITDEHKRIVVSKINDFCMKVKEGCTIGLLCKQKGYSKYNTFKAPPLTKYDATIEIGGKMGHLHAHIILNFDGVCHLDMHGLHAIADAIFNRTCKIDVKFFADVQQAMQAYIRKKTTVNNNSNEFPLIETPIASKD